MAGGTVKSTYIVGQNIKMDSETLESQIKDKLSLKAVVMEPISVAELANLISHVQDNYTFEGNKLMPKTCTQSQHDDSQAEQQQ